MYLLCFYFMFLFQFSFRAKDVNCIPQTFYITWIHNLHIYRNVRMDKNAKNIEEKLFMLITAKVLQAHRDSMGVSNSRKHINSLINVSITEAYYGQRTMWIMSLFDSLIWQRGSFHESIKIKITKQSAFIHPLDILMFYVSWLNGLWLVLSSHGDIHTCSTIDEIKNDGRMGPTAK